MTDPLFEAIRLQQVQSDVESQVRREELDRELRGEMPDLEQPCERCNGTGEVKTESDSPPYDKPCPDCDGLGCVPTEFGEKVLAFVLRRIKVSGELKRYP